MLPESETQAAPPANPWSAADVLKILCERGRLGSAAGADLATWTGYAAALLGLHAADRVALEDLLSLIFYYDAPAILARSESQAVMARIGAREVIRALANRVLEGPEIDSDRFKQTISALKDAMPYRGRGLFYPIRLALAGRSGEGELDRVILLLDSAARLRFAQPVKGVRQRMLEFCAALD